MVCSSLNIQYQSKGVKALPSLDRTELRQSLRYLFPSTNDTFWWPFVKQNHFGNSDKVRGVRYEHNYGKEMKYALVINAVTGVDIKFFDSILTQSPASRVIQCDIIYALVYSIWCSYIDIINKTTISNP